LSEPVSTRDADEAVSADAFRLLRADIISGALAAGESYSVARSFTVPINASVAYYLLVATDQTNLVLESSESNNVASSAVVDVTLTPLPDLIAIAVDAPDSALSGRSIDVSWTVENIDGDAPGGRPLKGRL